MKRALEMSLGVGVNNEDAEDQALRRYQLTLTSLHLNAATRFFEARLEGRNHRTPVHSPQVFRDLGQRLVAAAASPEPVGEEPLFGHEDLLTPDRLQRAGETLTGIAEGELYRRHRMQEVADTVDAVHDPVINELGRLDETNPISGTDLAQAS